MKDIVFIFDFYDSLTKEMHLVFDIDEESAKQRLTDRISDFTSVTLQSKTPVMQGLVLTIVDGKS